MNGLTAGWQSGTLSENLEKNGYSRRDFLKMCGELAAIYAVGTPLAGRAFSARAEDMAEKLGSIKKPNVAWLQLMECTGCMESTLRSGGTTIEEMVLDLLSVNYNELVMAASGTAADKALHDLNQEPHILVVNGSPSLAEDGIYCMIGGKTSVEVLKEAAENATVILAVGACAVYGSVQAARPNPTHAVGVEEVITDKPVINVSGCPPIGEVITATLAYLLVHGKPPKVDAEGRPLFAYDQRIHDSCPKRAHYDAGQFVHTFDDEGAKNGWCLYEVGCKGPSTFSPCPIVQWNLHTSWPIGAGHPCIGCTEKDFFDRFTPFYETLPEFPGFGIEATAEKVGLGLVGAAAAGVAIHAGITAAKTVASRKDERDTELLAAFGDPTHEKRGQKGPTDALGRELTANGTVATTTTAQPTPNHGGRGCSCGHGGGPQPGGVPPEGSTPVDPSPAPRDPGAGSGKGANSTDPDTPQNRPTE